MATWHERKQVWIASRQIKGQRKFFQSEVSEADADEQARAWAPLKSGPTFDSETFAAFVYGPWKANTWPELRQMSKDKYNGQLKNHILPILGNLPLAEIGLNDMLTLKGSLVLRGTKTPGKPMANRTANSILTLAQSILAFAKAAGRTQREDWSIVKKPAFRKKKLREEPPENFTADLIAAATGTWMAGPVFAAMFLGLRRGEVCGLKWSAIDRKGGAIRVSIQRQRQTGKGSVEVDTKGDERKLYVNDEMIGHLNRLGNKGSIYVFTGAEGLPIKPDKITAKMEGLCQLAKVPRTTFHDLRSHAASNLDAIGAELPVIMSILGHTKMDVSLLYINPHKAKIREAFAGLLSAKLGRQSTG